MKFIAWLKAFFASLKTKSIVIPDPIVPIEPEPRVIPQDYSWMILAKMEMGQSEYLNNKNNPRIIEYHATTTLKAKDQKIPWCSSFLNWCITKAGIKGTNDAWARSWLNWGVTLDQPKYGCVVILERGTDSGHVGFFIEESPEFVSLLSGNHLNSVNVSWFAKSRVLGYRWPKGT